MKEKIYITEYGDIHYYTDFSRGSEITLVFLPGLTADIRLFEKQTEYFTGRYNLLVWDRPGHYKSRPFSLEFTLMDKAKWLYEILKREGVAKPVLIGQSMGGYVSQRFMQLYPGVARGFVSIDSAPLKRKYTTRWEIWLLYHTDPMFRIFPWKSLVYVGSNGVATSPYGRQLMKTMMTGYTKDEYCRLSAHGFGMLARGLESGLPYEITCPALLICGEKDNRGSAKSYNKRWHKGEGLPIYWIKGRGHNSNTDRPEEVNSLIEDLLKKVK